MQLLLQIKYEKNKVFRYSFKHPTASILLFHSEVQLCGNIVTIPKKYYL